MNLLKSFFLLLPPETSNIKSKWEAEVTLGQNVIYDVLFIPHSKFLDWLIMTVLLRFITILSLKSLALLFCVNGS